MKPEMRKEHQWLQRLVGEWTFETQAPPAPGKAPRKFTGTESARSLGGVWVLCESQGRMADGEIATMQMTLGYDPARERYAGVFIGSMMTHLWVYDGRLDAEANLLTLDTEGPDFSRPGTTCKYRDLIEIKSADYRTLTSLMADGKGGWTEIMRTDYRRKP